MREITTSRPTFPVVEPNELLASVADGTRWQVLCGDEDRWRVGVYSPSKARHEEVVELEWHDCPEFFLLLEGRLTLVTVHEGERRDLVLEPNRPTLVTDPHCGICPDGPHTGRALVIERDAFRTEYRGLDEWKELTKRRA